MSNPNIFDNDEEEFRDQPDEVSGKSAVEILQEQHPGAPRPQRAPLPPAASLNSSLPEPGEMAETFFETLESEDDEDEDYSTVLSDARLRLEQGRLYETIMNHDLFEGMDADPAAVKHVQRQIRKFAKEQMEIMLGMRRETAKVERLEIDFPFNAVEVEVLRAMAKTFSKGRTENSDRYVPEVKKVTEEIPTVGATPRRTGLNPIVGTKKPAPAPVKQAVKQAPPPAPLKKTASAPVARQKKSLLPDQVEVEGEIITRSDVEAQYEPDYKPLEKPLHEMSSTELLRRNQETATRRHKTVKNPNAVPMPTYEQEEFMQLQRHAETAGKSNAVSVIMAAINNQNRK